jgi:hypothetical protein
MNPPSPAYPARFAQLTDVSTFTALAIDTWMQSQGCIDANGRILANPYQSVDSNATTINFKCSQTPLVAQFGAAPYNLTTSQANRLMDEFIIAYSEHNFMAEFNEKVLAFFARTLEHYFCCCCRLRGVFVLAACALRICSPAGLRLNSIDKSPVPVGGEERRPTPRLRSIEMPLMCDSLNLYESYSVINR